MHFYPLNFSTNLILYIKGPSFFYLKVKTKVDPVTKRKLIPELLESRIFLSLNMFTIVKQKTNNACPNWWDSSPGLDPHDQSRAFFVINKTIVLDHLNYLQN